MSADLSHIRGSWKASLDYLENLFGQAVAQSGDGTIKAEDAQSLAQHMRALGAEGWDSNRKIYTYSQLKLDLTIPAAEAGLIPWWAVMSGRAYAGDLDGLRKVYDLTRKKIIEEDSRPDVNSTLTWVSFPHKVNDSYSNKIRPDVLQQLFDWGADPNREGGKWLINALKECDAEAVDVWLDNGASLKTVVQVINGMNGRNAERHAFLLSRLPGRAYYDALDADTLLETKFVPDVGGTSAFKTVFNFKAQRVTEIYESPRQQQPVMVSSLFEDFSVTAVAAAREKLESITGKPVETSARIAKTPKPKLQKPEAGS